ncbi:hypothetical protein F5Y18DRAFT_440480 [Xylariaceae sp. FL1019]|nr:hypothetical protein F5Y18DRAFT_440480 [Xylariaceae sp. FL1019]
MADFAPALSTRRLDRALTRIREFKAFYIEAPPIGKSTKFVPLAWKMALQGRKEKYLADFGLYVQRHKIECKMLQAYLSTQSEDDIDLTCDPLDPFHPSSSRRLHLMSYEEMDRLLDDEGASAMLSGKRFVLFLDIEHAQTVQGELTLGRLFRWVSDYESISMTLILLAYQIPDPIGRILDRFHVALRTIKLDVDEPETKVERLDGNIEDSEHATARSLVEQALLTGPAELEVGDNPPATGPRVVLHGKQACIEKSIIKRIRHAYPASTFSTYELNHFSTSEDIDILLADNAPALICVDSTFPVVLPLENVMCVIALKWNLSNSVFHQHTSQYTRAETFWTKAEQARHAQWASKAIVADGQPLPSFYQYYGTPNNGLEGSLGETSRDLRYLCLALAKMFDGMYTEDVPVAVLDAATFDFDQLEETRRRLWVSGCISSHLDQEAKAKRCVDKLTQLGQGVLECLDNAIVNHERDFHVAYLLAYTKTRPGLTLGAKQFLARVCATQQTSFYSLTAKGIQMLDDDPDQFDKMLANCTAGMCREMCHNGAAWASVGILQSLIDRDLLVWDDGNYQTLTDRAQSPSAGCLEVDLREAVRCTKLLAAIEQILGIPNINNPQSLQLTSSEREMIHEALIWAHLDQILGFRYKESTLQEVVNILSRSSVVFTCGNHHLNIRRIISDKLEYAVYASANATFAQLAPKGVTLIPRNILSKIRDILGGDPLDEHLSTWYAI